MKKGINIFSFQKGKPYKECMTIAKDAGFDGIELAMGIEGELKLDSPEGDIYEVRRQAEKIGIELKSLVSGLYWKYSLTHNSAEMREDAKTIIKKHIRGASLLGCNTILLVPGGVGADFVPGFEVVDYSAAYDRALEALKELSGYAEQYKVHIGLENVWNKFLLSPLEFRDFIDKIGSGYVGCYFDVGNTLLTGYPEQWIRILGKNRIKKVHLKDFKKDVGTLSGFVDLLSGDVNFIEVINALKEIGYDDYLTAEMIPPYKQYSDQIIYNTSRSMDRIINQI